METEAIELATKEWCGRALLRFGEPRIGGGLRVVYPNRDSDVVVV